MFQDVFIENLILNAGSKKEAAHCLMEELNLSKDAAYRRLRGDTSFVMEEIGAICKALNISLDHFLSIEKNGSLVIFDYNAFSLTNPSYVQFFREAFTQTRNVKEVHFSYSARTIPYNYVVYYLPLLYFSAYFFSKFIRKLDTWAEKPFKFEREHIINDGLENQRKILREYAPIYFSVASTEIWNLETVGNILQRIKYCIESGSLVDKKTIDSICDSLISLLSHIEYQAKEGFKFLPGKLNHPLGTYNLYYNEAISLDYTVVRKLKETYKVYIVNNLCDYLSTSDLSYVNRTKNYFEQIIKSSACISSTNEKMRNQVFSNYRNNILMLKEMY